jgi:hypothetical protein
MAMAELFPTIGTNEWRQTFKQNRKLPPGSDMKMILGLLLIGTAKLHASDDLLFLHAISMVETGEKDSAVGPCGSVSRYQISPDTWREFSEWPIEDAIRPLKAQIVALKILQSNRRVMQTDSYWTLACGWLRGPRYHKYKETNSQLLARIDYANRVVAILKDLKTKQK